MTPEEAERLRMLELKRVEHEVECAAQHRAFSLRLGTVERLLWWGVAGWFLMMATILGKDTEMAVHILKALAK